MVEAVLAEEKLLKRSLTRLTPPDIQTKTLNGVVARNSAREETLKEQISVKQRELDLVVADREDAQHSLRLARMPPETLYDSEASAHALSESYRVWGHAS